MRRAELGESQSTAAAAKADAAALRSSPTPADVAAASGAPTPADSAAPAQGPPPTRRAALTPARVLSSEQLFAGATEVQIEHRGSLYRLKQTALGKLILTK